MIYLDDSIILLGAEYGRDACGHIHLITDLGIVDVTIKSERYYEEKHRTTIYDTVIDGTRKIKYEYSDNYGIFINNRNGQLHVFDTYIPGHRYIVVPSTKNMHERKDKVSSVFRPIPSFLLSDKVYILNNKPVGDCPHNEYIVDYLSWHKAKFGFWGSKPILNELGYLRPGFLHFCTTTKYATSCIKPQRGILYSTPNQITVDKCNNFCNITTDCCCSPKLDDEQNIVIKMSEYRNVQFMYGPIDVKGMDSIKFIKNKKMHIYTHLEIDMPCGGTIKVNLPYKDKNGQLQYFKVKSGHLYDSTLTLAYNNGVNLLRRY